MTAAAKLRTTLKEVAFNIMVRWIKSDSSGWAALWQPGLRKAIWLTQPPDNYLELAIRASKPKEFQRKISHSRLGYTMLTTFVPAAAPRHLGPIPSLSPELIAQIITALVEPSTRREICDNDTMSMSHLALKCLSLASRVTGAIAQPLLFRAVDLRPCGQRGLSRIQALEAMFKARPDAPGWVRVIKLGGAGTSYYSRPTIRGFLSILPRVFARLERLEAIEIRDLHINAEMLAHLFSLSQLRTLLIARVSLDENLELNLHDTAPRITQLQASDHRVCPSVEWLITKFAKSLTLQSLKTDFGVLDPVFNSLIGGPEPVFRALTSLALCYPKTITELNRFLQLGQMCPNVRRLRLSHDEAAVYPEGISRNVFPRLRDFEGPLHIAIAFMPDREMEVIDARLCSDKYSLSRFISDAEAGSRSLKELDAKVFDGGFGEGSPMLDLPTLFPQLKTLVLRLSGWPQVSLVRICLSQDPEESSPYSRR